MKKHQVVIISALLLIGLFSAVYQYVVTFKEEIVAAVQTIPNPGHSWAEMECNTDGLCVTGIGTNQKVGIGTGTPSQKLEVNGSILTTVDVCNGSGACLSQLNDFVGSQVLVNGAHTYADCTSNGGIIVDSDVSLKQCKFVAGICPTGWTQYKSYGKGGIGSGCANNCYGSRCRQTSGCTWPAWDWGPNPSTCVFTAYDCCGYSGSEQGTCTASGPYLQIGCF